MQTINQHGNFILKNCISICTIIVLSLAGSDSHVEVCDVAGSNHADDRFGDERNTVLQMDSLVGSVDQFKTQSTCQITPQNSLQFNMLTMFERQQLASLLILVSDQNFLVGIVKFHCKSGHYSMFYGFVLKYNQRKKVCRNVTKGILNTNLEFIEA